MRFMESSNLITGIILMLNVPGISYGQFQRCDYSYTVKPNLQFYLLSPNYPQKYNPGDACRYEITAPLDYEIVVECTLDIERNQDGCTTDYFYISRDGQKDLSGAEQFCGEGTITRTSMFRHIVIAFTSKRSSAGSRFNCTLQSRPQACDCGWSTNSRIVGGVPAGMGEFPSMAALYHVPSRILFCGGSIINHRTIVTADHCLSSYPNSNEVIVAVGDRDPSSGIDARYRQVFSVNRYIRHTNFSPTNNANDIALLILSSDIDWTPVVGPICLPFSQATNAFVNYNVYIAGWGTTSFGGSRPNTLQAASVYTISNTACAAEYSWVLPNQICTYYPNRDACQFDSGGPVVYKGSVRQFQLGIIAFGVNCGIRSGVNTRVTSFLDWIRNNSVGSFCNKPINRI